MVKSMMNSAFFICVSNRSEEHTSELQTHSDVVCRLLLDKKKNLPAPPKQRAASRASAARHSKNLVYAPNLGTTSRDNAPDPPLYRLRRPTQTESPLARVP